MKTIIFPAWIPHAACAGALLAVFTGVGRAQILGFEGIFHATPSNYGGAGWGDNYDSRGLRANGLQFTTGPTASNLSAFSFSFLTMAGGGGFTDRLIGITLYSEGNSTTLGSPLIDLGTLSITQPGYFENYLNTLNTLPSYTLNANTAYWIAITQDQDLDDFLQLGYDFPDAPTGSTAPVNGYVYHDGWEITSPPATFETIGGELVSTSYAFTFTAVVPEPSAAVLLGAGAVSLMARRRRVGV